MVIGQDILTNSFYPAQNTRQAARILRQLGTPFLTHQPSYSMFTRRHETKTSVVISASRVAQIDDAVGALQRLDFSIVELQRIETILG